MRKRYTEVRKYKAPISSVIPDFSLFSKRCYLFIYLYLKRAAHLAINASLPCVSKGAKIRNRYNQVPHLTQDTNGKVTNSQ